MFKIAIKRRENKLEEKMTIIVNFLCTSIYFVDFQHASVSSLLINFICWKECEFYCVYDPVTLALIDFYYDRLSKRLDDYQTKSKFHSTLRLFF